MSIVSKEPEDGRLFELNPDRWRACQEPHADIAALEAAVKGFQQAVSDARLTFRIADLLCVMRLLVRGEDGQERVAMLPLFLGAVEREEGLAAYAYGEAVKSRQEEIQKLLAGKILTQLKKQR